MSWAELSAELALWRREGMALPLWWRDDDAVAPSTALDRLAGLGDRLGIDVHLAVIPAAAEEALAQVEGPLVPLVHGWAHVSHAPEGEKKAEFGAHRPLAERLDEAKRGLERIEGLFGARARAVFVPPWNRIAPDMAGGLAGVGFKALSTFGPRRGAGISEVNTHLDPVDWHGTRSLADPERLAAQVAADLAARREGRVDAGEPYGLLTHHLIHDAALWGFTERMLSTLLDGGAVPWSFEKDFA